MGTNSEPRGQTEGEAGGNAEEMADTEEGTTGTEPLPLFHHPVQGKIQPHH